MRPHRFPQGLVISAILSLAFSLVPLFAQTPSWQLTKGPYHGTINCFARGPNGYLYAGTPVGVFRTPLDHDAWTLVSVGILDRNITALTIDSSGLLYAGTEHGVFRSLDEGGQWEIVNLGMGNTNVHALLSVSAGVLLAATDKGIYRSTDAAGSWEKTFVDSSDTSVLCLGRYPVGVLYAGGVSGLLTSPDSGLHWSHIEKAHSYQSISINSHGFIAVFRRDNYGIGGVAVSGDSGRTFIEPSYTWGGDVQVSVCLDENNQLFVGTKGLFEENYAGNLERHRILQEGDSSFSIVFVSKQSAIAGPVRSVFTADNNLVFASAGHVICSTDSGATYRDFMNGLTASRVLSLADNGRRTMLAGTQFAVFQMPDTASSWSTPEFLKSDRLLPILCLATDSSGLVLAGTIPGDGLVTPRGLYYSTDYGSSWHPYVNWFINTNAIVLDERGQFFAAASQYLVRAPYPTIYRTLLQADSELVSVAWADSTILYTGSVNGRVYTSSDTGTTWTSTHLVPAGRVQSLATLSNGRVYAGTSVGFFASSDRGSSWIQRGRGEIPSNVRVVLARPGVGILAGTPDGVFRSTDEGVQWEALDQGLTVKEIYSLCFGSDGWLYAGTSGGGVYRLPLERILSVQLVSFSVAQATGGNVELRWATSSEIDNYGFEVQRRLTGGAEFLTLENSFQAGFGTSTERHEYVFVDTTAGIGEWQYRLKQIDLGGRAHFTESITIKVTTGVEEAGTQPTACALGQNYPNPFNPTTRFRYAVGRVVVPGGALLSGVEGPASSKVSLVVYDLLGREVATLVNERKLPGNYEVTFDGSRLSSGVYICRMTAGAFVASKQMVLVK